LLDDNEQLVLLILLNSIDKPCGDLIDKQCVAIIIDIIISRSDVAAQHFVRRRARPLYRLDSVGLRGVIDCGQC